MRTLFDDALSLAAVNSITSVNVIDMQQMANEHEQSDCESGSKSLKIERLPLPTSD